MFAKWARHYWEQGLNVIPVMGKRPVTKDWPKYAKVRQEEEGEGSLELFETLYPDHGIGAVLGPSSGVMALDIDNPELLSSLPTSTLIRGGGKGKTVHFFKYSDNIKARSVPGLDIITTGRQVVLPPSPYPGDGKYEWLVGNGDFSSLPELTPEDDAKLARVMAAIIRTRSQQTGEMVGEGRNNSLIRMAYAMACAGHEAKDIATELLASQWGSWFSDPTEPHGGTSPKTEAEKMATRMIKNATKNGDRMDLTGPIEIKNITPSKAGPAPEAATPAPEPEVKVHPVDKLPPVPVPIPDGLLGDTMRIINDLNSTDIWGLALGGALSLWGTVLSNRFKFGRTWPNVFVLNLASSGTGKGASYKVINRLLDGTDLAGYGAYKTLSSCIRTLNEKRERLDCIDEIGDTFTMMNKGGVFQSELIGGMCALYSASADMYDAATTAESFKEGKQTKFCNPCISILGSTTEVGMVKSATSSMTGKGFMPRFIVLRQSLGEYKPLKAPDTRPIRQAILNAIEKFPVLTGEKDAASTTPSKINLSQDSVRNSRDKWRLPRPLVCHSENEVRLIQEWERESFEIRRRLVRYDDGVAVEDPMLPVEARRMEQITKLALIYAATESLGKTMHMTGASEPTFTGMTNYNGPRYIECLSETEAFTEHAQGADCEWVIKEKHLKWAREVFEASKENFEVFAVAIEKESVKDRGVELGEFLQRRILKLLNGAVDGLNVGVLRNKVSASHRSAFTATIRAMVEDGTVVEIETRSREGKGRPGKIFILPNYLPQFSMTHGENIKDGILWRD